MSSGRTKFTYKPLAPLRLRCQWCKELFDWKPQSTEHVLKHLRRTCSFRCQSGLAIWETERGIR